MKVASAAFALVAVVSLLGCPGDEKKSDAPATTAAATQSAANKPAAAPAAPKPSGAPSGGW